MHNLIISDDTYTICVYTSTFIYTYIFLHINIYLYVCVYLHESRLLQIEIQI